MILSEHPVLGLNNSRNVEGLADAQDAVLDAEVDEAVPAAPHDGVLHDGCLRIDRFDGEKGSYLLDRRLTRGNGEFGLMVIFEQSFVP